MSRQAGRPRAAVRSALAAVVLLAALVIPTGTWVDGAGPSWPVATSGPTVLTGAVSFRGRGYGHGVGMSQHGARGRALAGQSHATILAHYYRGTTLGRVDPATPVRVRVLSGFRPSAAEPFRIVGRGGPFTVDEIAGTFPAGAVVRLVPSATAWLATVSAVDGTELARRDRVAFLRIRPASASTLLELPPRPSSYDTYRGNLVVRAGASIGVVNEIALDLYLRGVVPAEVPSTWPTEAVRAQAIAARSFAVRRLHPTTGTYDLTDDTSTQVYHGREREATATNRAITDTAGVVVKSGSAVANTLFHSTGGAATEHNENVFVSSAGAKVASAVPYLRGRPDLRADGTAWDAGSPYATWKTDTYSIASLSAILAADPRTDVGTVRSLDLSARGVSGRLIKVVLRGSAGTRTVSGNVFRSAFNAHNPPGRPDLRSTIVDLVLAATSTSAPASSAASQPPPAAAKPVPPSVAPSSAKPVAATTTPATKPKPVASKPKPALKPKPKTKTKPEAATSPTPDTAAGVTVSTRAPVAVSTTLGPSTGSTGPAIILGGVSIVGPALPSPDGVWMAYTARSATERGGSDVHAWRPGLPAPIRLTVDGRSVLGGWAGRLVAVSAIVRGDGPSGDAPVTAAATRTTLIDPATGIVVGDAIADAWRPSIDPLGRFAIFWEGSVHSTPDGGPWRPSRGRLVLAGFGLEPDPSPADRHRRGQRPTAVTPVVTDRTPLTDGTGAPAMWSVAWDAAGSTARVWITDDAGLSRLVTVVPAELSGAFRSLPIQHRFRR